MRQPPSADKVSYRFRVHSAPPTASGAPIRTMAGRKLPPLAINRNTPPPQFVIEKPATPDPEKVRLILEQRISQALSGPAHRLKMQRSSTEDVEVGRNERRGSLLRSAAIGSEDMHLVPIDDDEMAMLRSINKSEYSSKRQDSEASLSSSPVCSSNTLYKHEYEDNSSEEDEDHLDQQQLKNRRKTSMIRQQEQEDVEASLDGIRLGAINAESRQSGIRNSEERLTGYRHEKMRSTTKSGEVEDDQISGLVYDMDFDCYYNPRTDKYYRLKSQSKSGEDVTSITTLKEIS